MDEYGARQWQRCLRSIYGTLGLMLPRGFPGRDQKWAGAVRYGFALLISGVAVWLRIVMNLEYNHDALRLLSVIAIAFAAWFGGLGPGIFATLIGLGGSVAITASIPAEYLSIAHALRLLLFLFTGCIVSALTEALSRTRLKWRHAEEAQENRVLQERNRMAREIHDTLAQGLTGIIIQLEAAEDILTETPEQSEMRAHLLRAKDLARISLTEARRSVSALRPLSVEGKNLAEALTERFATMTAGTDIDVAVTVQGTPYLLAADCEDHLLRIALEALTNAIKHARARAIRVHLLFTEKQVTLTVRDNGQGFRPDAPQPEKGFGLIGMRERAERIGGRLDLTSRPGRGTEIVVIAPRTPTAQSMPVVFH